MNDNQNQHDQQHGQQPDQGQAFTGFSPAGGVPYGQGPIVKKHSGLGIASFVLALVALLTFILSIILIASSLPELMNMTSPEEFQQRIIDNNGEGFEGLVIGSFIIFLAVGIAFIGFVLGIIGLFMKNRKKVFSIIGTVLNGLITIGSIFMLILGLATSI
ncbi:hypothetical protein D3P07_22125 [Paenibacillus sp. 1011MAR3C5]|uniref:hypothetical protein n=1 Tax=Paenibacillus sp. 1011MAR3C5 TaxID=1675787 RepID=UPI000E6C1083|nr:hypothetical protein [Paenibacillus sp. 1011MAR3C5]RJE84632.1 hypothetical protein D3P07_22125 [Paenibacillus sp. 1011MAR3C5]